MSKYCLWKHETLMFKIICKTAENVKRENLFFVYGMAWMKTRRVWVDGQHLHHRWKTDQKSWNPVWGEERWLLLEVLLLSTHLLFSVDFLASSRSLLKQKGTAEATKVPLSQPCDDTASQLHKKLSCRDTNLFSRTRRRLRQLFP